MVKTSIPRILTWPFAAVLLVAGPLLFVHALASNNSIVLASTTSVENSGLLPRILPKFTERTGIVVRVVAQGTGQALDTARRGDATSCWSTIPRPERKFAATATGSRPVRSRGTILSSSDRRGCPAHVKGSHDAVAAFKSIEGLSLPSYRGATAAAPTHGTSPMEGGRCHAEQGPRRVLVPKRRRRHGPSVKCRFGDPGLPLSDRGTWLSFANEASLVIEVEGDPRLINRYEVIELNPQKHAEAKIAAAKILADWLASPEGQKAIESYQVGGQQLHPSADGPK